MAESGESTNGYRTGATARGSASFELCVVVDTLEGWEEPKGWTLEKHLLISPQKKREIKRSIKNEMH